MNEQELRELALKLANQYGDDVGSYDFEFDDHGIVAVVRAAVAHGLRIGAGLCDDNAEGYGRAAKGHYDGTYDAKQEAALECSIEIRTKADELEAR